MTSIKTALAVACVSVELALGACTRSTPSVAISQGTVNGFRDASGNSVYLGIPFAAATGGENR